MILELARSRRLLRSKSPLSNGFRLCQYILNGFIGGRDAQRSYGVSIQIWLTEFDRSELDDDEAEATGLAPN